MLCQPKCVKVLAQSDKKNIIFGGVRDGKKKQNDKNKLKNQINLIRK